MRNPLVGTGGQLMVMAAHRYCLGRRSYIVLSCIDWLREVWQVVGNNTRNVIVRDTVEALQDMDWRVDGHIDVWKEFAEWAFAQMAPSDQGWCKNAVAHRRKPWPLGEEAVR